MRELDCSRAHADQILAIFNDAIATSTALWDYEPRTAAMMEAWFDAKEAAAMPVVGIEDDRGRLAAFGTFGTFRAWPAYKYSAESSVYVHRDARGRGLGTRILDALIEQAHARGLHTLVAGIAADNVASIALHRRCGFDPCGTIRQAGFKFGTWIDLAFYQRILDTPEHPVDGSG